MACKRSPVRSRYSPPLAQIRVTNTVDFKSKSTVFLCLSASKFIAILQILCKIKVEVHMDLVSAINFYPADKLADDHLFCFKAGTIVQVCVRDQNTATPYIPRIPRSPRWGRRRWRYSGSAPHRWRHRLRSIDLESPPQRGSGNSSAPCVRFPCWGLWQTG